MESPGIAMISTLLTCGPCPTLLFSQWESRGLEMFYNLPKTIQHVCGRAGTTPCLLGPRSKFFHRIYKYRFLLKPREIYLCQSATVRGCKGEKKPQKPDKCSGFHGVEQKQCFWTEWWGCRKVGAQSPGDASGGGGAGLGQLVLLQRLANGQSRSNSSPKHVKDI